MIERQDASTIELENKRVITRKLLQKLNNAIDAQEKKKIANELFASVGSDLIIWQNFFCEFGKRITLGDQVIINANCAMLGDNKIIIGNGTQIGSFCGFYTTTPSRNIQERLLQIEYGGDIKIGENVLIGGHVIILPGMTIGNGASVGAGSTVFRHIKENETYISKVSFFEESVNTIIGLLRKK